jgi:hypothetical protein
MFRNYLFIAILLPVVFSCNKKVAQDEVPSLGYEYFPLITGKSYIYQVDSLGYDNNSGSTTIDTLTYYYKIQMGDAFTDGAGMTSYFIQRYFADSLNGPWNEVNTWTALRTNERAEQVEENIRYVKLIFPVTEIKSWDGNMMNSLGFERYRVVAFQQPFLQFDNTIAIQQRNDSNAIEVIRKQERYAAGIGLVYLKRDSINTQISGSRGYRYQLTLISHQ